MENKEGFSLLSCLIYPLVSQRGSQHDMQGISDGGRERGEREKWRGIFISHRICGKAKENRDTQSISFPSQSMSRHRNTSRKREEREREENEPETTVEQIPARFFTWKTRFSRPSFATDVTLIRFLLVH